ncbi:hypothetical protein RFN28_19620 [Mesorhizobium sp. VK24D]|uniref:Uncharacterized protein n=1 Tax=Mesorhizobium album TaxID=3072314 RepID=A0ABU4Y129_9HYPH|nr:hypothetical protein [Mesorhizobium sp. VK24D]MDX8480657.1 hypothetical protein [Mesorhizobium sp. VK24D]
MAGISRKHPMLRRSQAMWFSRHRRGSADCDRRRGMIMVYPTNAYRNAA